MSEGQPSRHGQLVKLLPHKRELYLQLHAAVWPEVESQIRRSHIGNYTIFLHGDLLFSFFEYSGTDLQADLDQMAADPATQAWWALTAPCQEPLEGTPASATWAEGVEVWHLD